MNAIIIRVLFLGFFLYVVLALVIACRDVSRFPRSSLWFVIATITLTLGLILFWTSALPYVAFPLALTISIPIFLTDKRRDWDAVDRVFRWLSIFTIIGSAFISLNYFFWR